MIKRTTYTGQPVGQTAEAVRQALAVDLEKRGGIREVLHARAKIDEAMQRDEIAEADMLSALNFMERSASVVDEARNEMKPATPQGNTPSASSAPAYVREVGDSSRGIVKRFSIARAVSNVIDGRAHDGAELEMITEGRGQFRGASGQIVVPDWAARELRTVFGTSTTPAGIGGQVSGLQTIVGDSMQIARHGQPLAEQLGARVIDGLGGQSVLLPWLGKTSAAVSEEGAQVTSAGDFQQVTLTPTRYTRALTVSEMSLRTTGGQMDSVILADMSAALSTSIDAQAFAALQASAVWVPGTVHDTNGLAVTSMADIHNLVSGAMDATGLNSYPDLVVSRLGASALNTALSGSDTTISERYIGQTGARIIPAVNIADGDVTSGNAVGGSGTISGAGIAMAGDMSALAICRWGGFDLRVDFYGDNAARHNVTLYANSYSAAGLLSDAFVQLAVTAENISAT
jgi:hypothetical protein